MEAMLRRNVILRDWRNGINKYRSIHYGNWPSCVEMNRATFKYVMKHVYKYKLFGLEFRQDVDYSTDRYGARVVEYTMERILFEGIEIFIRNDLEKEIMRIW